MSEDKEGPAFAIGMLVTGVLIAGGVLIGEFTACSARQNVRHECDVYGKTELENHEATGEVPYTCAPVEVKK